ncbi:hypothetical protein ACFFKU_07625 [Kineococcus gynurae]|uniref:Uncharacterized protein n=1 Tax=Kineococcus gynurae TaxID=452979 RepID=A0ABV5LWI4_9ACTN
MSSEHPENPGPDTDEAPRSTDEPGTSAEHGEDRSLKGPAQDGYGNDTGFAEAAEDADENVDH